MRIMMRLREHIKMDVGVYVFVFLAIIMRVQAAAVPGGCDPLNVTSPLRVEPVNDVYMVGDNITFSCNETNQHLRGASVLVCQNDSTWSDASPGCYDSVCTLDTPPNGPRVAPLYPSYAAQEQVAFQCLNTSQQLVGKNTTRCLEDGTWTNQVPLCLGMGTCGAPPLLPPHISTTICHHVGCDSYYSCYDRQETITCTSNGTWTEFQGPCTETWCASPVTIHNATYSTDTNPNNGWYQVDTRATYSCEGELQLMGQPELTCLGNGTWTAPNFTCEVVPSSPAGEVTVNNTTVGDITTQGPQVCQMPNDPPTPNLVVRRNGVSILYSCNAGYELTNGNRERTCLPNGTWTGTAPHCTVAPPSIVPTGSSSFRWEQVFIAYKDWTGRYTFRSQDIQFHFDVQSVQLDGQETVTGLLAEDDIQFELKGYRELSGGIILKIKRLVTDATERFPSTEWSVLGHLVENECTWSYVGQVNSEVEGFDTFTMFTNRDDVENEDNCSQTRNMSMVIVSISLACLLVIALGIIAIICIRRTAGVRSSGHRTLTSFENPVYEYEHGLTNMK